MSLCFSVFLLCDTVQPRTPLEEEVAAVLRGSSHVLERNNKELTEEEEKALLAMDLEEVSEFFKMFVSVHIHIIFRSMGIKELSNDQTHIFVELHSLVIECLHQNHKSHRFKC